MATTIRSADLDFDTIKSRLKEFLRKKSEFEDYDFEASGLSNILDVLAYNTHLNGLTANFALNESFLNTAQLRSSLVSHAESLGYTPKSFTSSEAKLNLSYTISNSSRPTTITLLKDTPFTASVDGVTYTFQTRENFTATDNGSGLYQFVTSTDSTDIPVFEGTIKNKTFFAGDVADSQIYVIPDVTIDTSTIEVQVFETATSTTVLDTYTNINKAVRITSDSTHYQIKEVPNGYFEIIFGDGFSTGKAPTAGNKIVVNYLSTKGPAANNASTFSNSTQFTNTAQSPSQTYNLSVTTSSSSAGGAFKESIESIRQNAGVVFSSQRRLVTAEDYRAQINANYGTYLDDVIAYGGADNDPPKYGCVYVGLKFKDNITTETKDSVKDEIITELSDNLGIMSIDIIYLDPVTSFLELTTTFNFDPDLTDTSAQGMQTNVTNKINEFFAANLNKFNKVFRRSTLLTQIDDISDSILNSKMEIKVQQRLVPSVGSTLSYTINFPMAIAAPDDVNFRVTTSKFTFNSRQCSIRNLLNSNTLQIINEDGGIEVSNIGTYNQAAGRINLTGFAPTAVDGESIKFSVVPANQSTIRPLRNFVLDIDKTRTNTLAVIDNQNTLTTL